MRGLAYNIASTPRQVSPAQPIKFNGWPLGLNTILPASQISKGELSECLNFKVNRGGQLETRAPFTKHTSAATTSNSPVKRFAILPIGGTEYELLIDDNDRLYYSNAGTPTLIGTLEANAQLIAFKGVVLVLDGSYIKYLDGVSSVKIAYDDGTGTSGYQFNNRTGDDDTHTDLGNGTITRVASKFTSQAWDSGYTIPLTKVFVSLQRAGNGYTGTDNVDVDVHVRKVSDNSSIGNVTLVSAPLATNLPATLTEFEATFAAGDLDPNTAYYCSVEYNNGDATHHVEVHASTVASGGVGYNYDGSWNAETTKDPLIGLKPGMPPKGAFGEVHDGRPFIAGDPDNLGYVWFGNLTYLDWSTNNGGGYIGAVDDDANGYEVGALKSIYEDLYIFGTQEQPYLAKLSGAAPSYWEINALYQRTWTTQELLADTLNDLWFASENGIDALSGVQEYGDLRGWSYSEQIFDRIRDYFVSTTAMAAYNPKDGQYMLYMPTHPRIVVVHVKNPVPDQTGSIPRVRYPISEYEITLDILTDSDTYKWTASGSGTNEYYLTTAAGGDPSFDCQPDFIKLDGIKLAEGTVGSLNDHEWDYGDNDGLGYSTVYVRDDSGDPDASGVDIRTILAPSCIAEAKDDIYVGGNDGYVYKLDRSDYKDMSEHQIWFDARTIYTRTAFGDINLVHQAVDVAGEYGGLATLKVYANDQILSSTEEYSYSLVLDDRLILSDLTGVDVEDAYFSVEPAATYLHNVMNIICRSFQAQVTNIYLSGAPVYINSIGFNARVMQI